jgi:diguanylate cyclase (GGDEF)-like protein
VAEAIITIDDTIVVEAANRAAGDLFRCEPMDLVGRRLDHLMPGYRVTLGDLIPGAQAEIPSRREAAGQRSDGTRFTAEVETTLVLGDDGPIRIVVLRDVTELRAKTAALAHQALHDGLTDLPNRRHFADRLVARVSLAARSRIPFSVYVMDMDNFKDVNDSLGHHAGDVLLQSVAQRLIVQMRPGDLIARLGGDEFAILPGPNATPVVASRIAADVLEAFAEPFLVDGHAVETGISIGIAHFPEHGSDAETLMRHADTAMYSAKRSRVGWHVYRPSSGPAADAAGSSGTDVLSIVG